MGKPCHSNFNSHPHEFIVTLIILGKCFQILYNTTSRTFGWYLDDTPKLVHNSAVKITILLRNIIQVRKMLLSTWYACMFVFPDQRFVVRKSPALLQEMINVGCQLTMMANSRGGTHIYCIHKHTHTRIHDLRNIFIRHCFYTMLCFMSNLLCAGYWCLQDSDQFEPT